MPKRKIPEAALAFTTDAGTTVFNPDGSAIFLSDDDEQQFWNDYAPPIADPSSGEAE